VILAYAAGHALFVATLRYRITVMPLVFLFTGVGAAGMLSLMRRHALVRLHAQTRSTPSSLQGKSARSHTSSQDSPD
jgi:hypothetical protein